MTKEFKEKMEAREKDFFAYLLANSEDLRDDLKLYRVRNPLAEDSTHSEHENRDNNFIRSKLIEFKEKYGRKMGDLEFYLIKAALIHQSEYRVNSK